MRVTRSVTSKFFNNVTTNYDAFRSASSMFVPFLLEPILWISARRKNGLAASPSTKTRFRRSLYSAKRSIRFLSRQSNIFLLCTTGNITDFFIFFSFASLSLSLSLSSATPPRVVPRFLSRLRFLQSFSVFFLQPGSPTAGPPWHGTTVSRDSSHDISLFCVFEKLALVPISRQIIRFFRATLTS